MCAACRRKRDWNSSTNQQTHLGSGCQSPAVPSGSAWSSRSWAPAGGSPSPGWAAHARRSSPGRRPRRERVWAPCSRNAACWRLWNWRTRRSRYDAGSSARAEMMRSPASPRCKPATAPGPGSGGPPGSTPPSLIFHSHLQTCSLIKYSTSSGRPRCRGPVRQPLHDIRR